MTKILIYKNITTVVLHDSRHFHKRILDLPGTDGTQNYRTHTKDLKDRVKSERNSMITSSK